MFLIALLTGCSDADWNKTFRYGDPAHISCYSGGQKFYEGDSTGAVEWREGGGAAWVDKKTGMLVETFADCMFEVKVR